MSSRSTVRLQAAIKFGLLSIVAFVLVLGPFWLVLVNSWKTNGEATQLSFALPTTWAVVENYTKVFTEGRMARGFLNTVIVSTAAIALLLTLGAGAGWVFARGRRWPDRVGYYLVALGIILPPAVVTTVLLLKVIGVYGGQPGLVLFYIGGYLPLCILLLTGFVKAIPMELEDAARIDGCSHFGVFFRIILPLMRPALAATGVVLLIFIWNEFYWAFFVLQGLDNQTLTLGVYTIGSGAYKLTLWNLMFTNVVLVSLPLLIVYYYAQRHLVAGLTGGALRG